MSLKDTQKINRTSSKQPFLGSRNMDSKNGTNSRYNSHSIKDDAQLSCTEPSGSGMAGSIWRLYVRYQKLRHEMNHLREEGRGKSWQF